MGRKILCGAFIPKSFESRLFFQRLIRCRMGSFKVVPNRWMSGLGFAPSTPLCRCGTMVVIEAFECTLNRASFADTS